MNRTPNTSMLCKALVKLCGMSNGQLSTIETGRTNDRWGRLCTLCGLNNIKDEKDVFILLVTQATRKKI